MRVGVAADVQTEFLPDTIVAASVSILCESVADIIALECNSLHLPRGYHVMMCCHPVKTNYTDRLMTWVQNFPIFLISVECPRHCHCSARDTFQFDLPLSSHEVISDSERSLLTCVSSPRFTVCWWLQLRPLEFNSDKIQHNCLLEFNIIGNIYRYFFLRFRKQAVLTVTCSCFLFQSIFPYKFTGFSLFWAFTLLYVLVLHCQPFCFIQHFLSLYFISFRNALYFFFSSANSIHLWTVSIYLCISLTNLCFPL
jgi:hypothetical protein